MHIFVGYGIIGQQIHLHRRNLILFVYNVHPHIAFANIGQSPVIIVPVAAVVLVRDNDVVALVEVEFGVELRLFGEERFQLLRLFERLFRLFFGNFEVGVYTFQSLFKSSLSFRQIV